MADKEELSTSGVTDMISGIKLPKTVQSMNAYLGAGAITKALNQGADIVVTGRCVDSAVVLGPLQHTFGWKYNDYDLLSAGSLAGHLVECGAQVTGGIYTDWHTVPAWDNIGFPIVECSDDGTFIVTKPPQTGGLVSFGTVAEQLVYEIGNPKQYMLPDVTCDFSQVQIQPVPGKEKEAMYVKGAKGSPPSNHYKVSATYADGYRLTVVSTVAGPWAAEKARRTGEAILKRTRRMFKQLGITDYTKTLIQVIGSEQTYGPHAYIDNNPREVALWLAAHHSNKKALEILAREVAPAGTGMAPGLMSLVGGRPKVSPVLKLFSFLHPKDKIQEARWWRYRYLRSRPADRRASSQSVFSGGGLHDFTGCSEAVPLEVFPPMGPIAGPLVDPSSYSAGFAYEMRALVKGLVGQIAFLAGRVDQTQSERAVFTATPRWASRKKHRSIARIQNRSLPGYSPFPAATLPLIWLKGDSSLASDTADTSGGPSKSSIRNESAVGVMRSIIDPSDRMQPLTIASTLMGSQASGSQGNPVGTSPVLMGGHWSAAEEVKVHMDDKEEIVTNPTPVKEEQETEYDSPISDSSVLKSGSHTFRLVDLAYTRSGDKGNSSNIGVIARHPYFMPYLRQALTEDVVHKYFQHVLEPMENNRKTKQVTRYELPGIHALNFILENSLGGGGIASLRCDPQGKAYGQMLLDMKIENVPNLVEMAEIISDQ
uniref:Uncharacterized protein LOC102801419 n=1 Tax=Saccoglossus kowalevskii TaxID=10224 RepID=A0ABM0MJG3_SACKO|nr:PREDICTED: uncharacterized protein LOC102801419 [Saccoglossus kowalevskii]